MDAIRTTEIEEVIFVPAWISPFKKNRKCTEYTHRYRMLELAIEDNSRFNISDIEGRRKGVSYTYQTLKEIKKTEKNICLMIGEDQAANFKKWHRWEQLLEEFDVYVFKRKGSDIEGVNNFILLDSRIIEISSTEVRKFLRNGSSVQYLIPEKVHRYIQKNNLYTS